MGVQGLFKFLQSNFPGVLNRIPDRFQNFGGKTIVLDGTLITQRFHFSQIPHQYRHVLGWYRLVSELRRHNVNAICVFDGKERSAAKAAEIERRRDVRNRDLARAYVESERLARLGKLQKIIGSSRAAKTRFAATAEKSGPEEETTPESDTRKTDAASADLDKVLLSRKPVATATPLSDPPPSVPSKEASSTASSDRLNKESIPQNLSLLQIKSGKRSSPRVTQQTTSDLASTNERVPSDDSLLKVLTQIDTNIPSQEEEISPGSVSKRDSPLSDESSSNVSKPEIATANVDVQQDEISELFQQYQSAVSKPESSEALKREDAPESKSQILLNHDEDDLWNTVLSRTPPTARVVSNLLEDLTDRSQLLLESLERRNPPTSMTYVQSQAMLKALGIPCIECDGPFEAEALASSLVHNRLADYVASEDTDVIVYDAPLLRNVTSRQGELICVSGEGVREAMKLSRESFLDFALLIGTDFTDRLHGVGPIRALRFISIHGSIEEVLLNQPQYAPRTAVMKRSYLRQIRHAREVFKSLPSVPDSDMLRPRAVDQERVVELLVRFELTRSANDDDWDPQLPLAGNYFNDDPRS